MAYVKGSMRFSFLSLFSFFLAPPPSCLTPSYPLPFYYLSLFPSSPFFSLFFLRCFHPFPFSLLYHLLILYCFILSPPKWHLNKYIADLSQSKVFKIVCNFAAVINHQYSVYMCLAQGTVRTTCTLKWERELCGL